MTTVTKLDLEAEKTCTITDISRPSVRNLTSTIPIVKQNVEKLSNAEMIKKQNAMINTLIDRKHASIDKILLTPISDEDISNMTVCDVIYSSTTPGKGTLFDAAMGPTDSLTPCFTCGNKITDCPGHMGRIPLTKPLINPLFKEETVLTLRCVCNYCGHIFVNKDDIENNGINKMSGRKRLKAIAELSEKNDYRKRHPECAQNPTYQKPKKSQFDVCFKDKYGMIERSPANIIKIFSMLTKQELNILGFINSHPKNFIMKSIPVIPSNRRPKVYIGTVGDDPLTILYSNIVSKNNDLKNKLNINSQTSEAKILEGEVYYLYMQLQSNKDGKLGNIAGADNEKSEGLIPRIGGKNGKIRRECLGVRSDFTARTVLGPSENDFQYIATPEYIRSKLTTRETVTKYSLPRLTEMYKRGEVPYIIASQGLNKPNRRKVDMKTIESYELKIGDVVDRYAMDEDPIYFGRQPTIQRQCFEGYRIKFQNKDTMGLHQSCNGKHNADFDGDEGTIHMFQNIKAKVEALTVANVTRNIMSSQNNKPMIANAFNSVIASYLMSNNFEVDIDISNEAWDKALNLSFNMYRDFYDNDFEYFKKKIVEKFSIHDVKQHSARGLYSLALPPDFGLAEFDWVIIDGVANVGVPEQKMIRDDRFRELYSTFSDMFMNDQGNYEKLTLEETMTKKELNVPLYLSEKIKAALNDEKTFSHDQRCKNSGIHPLSKRSMLSMAFPEDFNYKNGDINVVDGILVTGTLDKGLIGSSPKSFVKIIGKIYNAEMAALFINYMQRITDIFIEWCGFSVGYSACDNNREQVRREVIRSFNTSQIALYELGKEPETAQDKYFYKKRKFEILNNTKETGKRIGQLNLKQSNPLNQLGARGSSAKGNDTNTAQITGSLGEQFSNGDLPVKNLNNGARSQVYFTKGDMSAKAQGYIISSFKDGIDPKQYIFHATSSREGLIDTASKTAKFGHLHRIVRKSVEDTVVTYSGAVGTVDGVVFQPSCNNFVAPGEAMLVTTEERGSYFSPVDCKMLAHFCNAKYKMPVVPKTPVEVDIIEISPTNRDVIQNPDPEKETDMNLPGDVETNY